MRHMGLDLGRRRIGVAISDQTGAFARDLAIIPRRSKAQVFAELQKLAEKWQVERLVVGLPLSLGGEKGAEARWAERYGRELGEALGLAVVLWDERLTTVEAENQLRQLGRSVGRKELDARAAAVMLQAYLDDQRGKPG